MDGVIEGIQLIADSGSEVASFDPAALQEAASNLIRESTLVVPSTTSLDTWTELLGSLNNLVNEINANIQAAQELHSQLPKDPLFDEARAYLETGMSNLRDVRDDAFALRKIVGQGADVPTAAKNVIELYERTDGLQSKGIAQVGERVLQYPPEVS